MSKGYVYILSNPSMPGMVKIGKTTRNVETDYFVDPSTLDIAASRCGVKPEDMDFIFSSLTEEELAPAAERFAARLERIRTCAQPEPSPDMSVLQ